MFSKNINLIFFFIFQNVLFYVISDDDQWAKDNLVNESYQVYYAGSGGTSFSQNDKIGKSRKIFELSLL